MTSSQGVPMIVLPTVSGGSPQAGAATAGGTRLSRAESASDKASTVEVSVA
jgi:hypothetical protein